MVAARARTGLHHGRNLTRQGGADFLIGVNGKNPVVRGLFGGKVFLLRVTAPRLLDDPRTKALGDRLGTVSGAAVNHHDFIGKRHAADSALYVGSFVQGDDGGTERSHVSTAYRRN